MNTNIQKSSGTVKFVSVLKGYGFVTDNLGYDFFFSLSGFDRSISKGDQVTFEAYENGKGMAAKHIKKLGREDPDGSHIVP